MSPDPVVIVGLGTLTPVGVTAAETAASVRAGTTRFAASRMQDRVRQPFVIAEVPEDALAELPDHFVAPLSARERRLLRMAVHPLRECLAAVAGARPTIGLSLALPELETTKPLDRAAFPRHLQALVGAIDATRSDASHRGRAGGVIAIGQAVLALRAGTADFMVAGAIDTHRDVYVLGVLDKERRVKSAVNGDGFIPGEAAAFLLLTRASTAAAHRLPVIARVSPVAVGFETGHLHSEQPYRGDGLASTISSLLAQGDADGPIGEVYSSMNGENYWAKEWGVAMIRNQASFSPDHRMHHPADCVGDSGAASGPLMAALAALGIQQGYRRAPALVYGSSDSGPRAAVLLTQ